MDEKLTELWAKSSNAPSQPSRGASNHAMVSAIAKGFAPVIRDELDKLKAENAALRAENVRLTTEVRTEIASLQGELRAVIAENASQRREFMALCEKFDLPMASPVRRVLSS